MRRTTGQPRLSAIVQTRRLSLFGHIAMPDEADARSIITASPSENWRKPPGRPRTAWMKTIQQDLRSNNLSLDEAITVAQNRPLWRLMSAFWRYAPLVVLATQEAVAAPAIDKAGPRPYHFCPGPTSGPTTRPQEVKEVKIKSPLKFSIRLITRHLAQWQPCHKIQTLTMLTRLICVVPV